MGSFWGTRQPPPGVRVDWSHPLSQGLVGLWLFNEGAGSAVSNLVEPQRMNTLVNTPTWRSGPYGYGLRGNGSNTYVAVPYHPIRDCARGITLEALIDTGTASNVVVIGKPFDVTHTAPFFDFSMYLVSDLSINFRLGADTHNQGAWTTNTIMHIVLTADGATKRWYTQGREISTAASAGLPTNTNSRDVRLGANATPGEGFGGTYFKAAIYDRALGPTDIAMLFAEPYCLMADPSWRKNFTSGGALTSVRDLIGSGFIPFAR